MDNLSEEEIRNMEAEINARRSEVKPIFQHYGSAENLSDSDIRGMEAEIGARRSEVKPIFQHYGSAENLSDSDIRGMEAEIGARRSEVKPIFQHYGSAENLSDSDIRGMEAEINARRSEVKPIFQHYGSAENLNDSDIRSMEAQVAEKKKQDIPYKEYLNDLVNNPNISDTKQFEDAVIRSMESNNIMKNLTTNLVEKISEATYGFKNIEKTDTVNIQNQKQKLESLVNIYVKYLYELKNHGWEFYGSGNNIGLDMIDSDMLEDLWQVQKRFDITFNMPIPKKLEKNSEEASEIDVKMVPGFTLMYDDLKGKQVNWHQVIVDKESELIQQQKEEAIKEFDLTRQQEIKNTIVNARTQNQQNIDISVQNIENQEQLDATSARR